MASLADAINAQMNTPYALSPEMGEFIGRPIVTHREVLDALRAYATANSLYCEGGNVIKPDPLLAELLSHPAPFNIKDTNALIARHLIPK